MGDLAELRGLVFVVCFLAISGFLATMIYGYYGSTYSQREVTVPEYFESVDVQSFAFTHNFTINFGGAQFFSHSFPMAGWNVRLDAWRGNPFVPNQIKSYHFEEFWIFSWNFHTFEWFSGEGISYGYELLYTELDTIWNNMENKNQTIRCLLKSDQTQFTVYFGWDTETYSLPSEALWNNAMQVLYCIGIDEVNTAQNIWSIIAMLLFYKIPDVHWTVDVIIKVPTWTTIAYLVFVLIMKIFPWGGD